MNRLFWSLGIVLVALPVTTASAATYLRDGRPCFRKGLSARAVSIRLVWLPWRFCQVPWARRVSVPTPG